ncbi:alpha/beta fold hydrolase [Actinomadura opuntiae]|uniref:alpha/beta fold hydrolase n=1 Tax=Actinomadura sp. OS1-43 TaxID=604315 RepID=UPI00255AF8C3|nr:alpha/beta hydrolase [Actinomadura sp. OS1-43]MDL4814110.1 alpha/beta hydrolase [Actinomadura sp. OS1-43]
MNTAHVNGVDIQYELTGQGEPMLLIHGSNIATGLRPLATALSRSAPSLSLLRYHRRGMGGSTGRGGPFSIEQDAADALGLLDALDLPSAHIAGYSYGATVAVQTALTAPKRTRSLILLEPILKQVPSATRFFSGMHHVMDRYSAGDMAGAVTATFASLGGDNWSELIATAGADAFGAAVRDTEIFYRGERPSLDAWRFDPDLASAVRAPVLSVLGMRSGPFFTEGRDLIHQHFPQCTDADIPGVNHLLNLQAPELIASEVAHFLNEHSLAEKTS